MVKRLALAALIMISLTGCGSAVSQTREESPKTASVGGVENASPHGISRVRSYDSLQAVIADADLVVTVTRQPGQRLVPADAEGTSGDRSVLLTFRVDEVHRGSGDVAAGDLLTVREPGPGFAVDPARWRVGGRYVLVAHPFTFASGKHTGQWVLVDPVSAYAVDGDGTLRRVDGGQDDEAGGIPVTTTRDGLQAAVRSASRATS